MMQQRERRLLALLSRYSFDALGSKQCWKSAAAPVIGCGNSSNGARPENVTGIDLLADRVSRSAAVMSAGRAHSLRERGAASFLFGKLRRRFSIDGFHLDS